MCHSQQFVEREFYRGSSSACRLYCMKMNNKRIESDDAFMDDNPRERMNGSLRSELSDSFANSSSCFSNNSFHNNQSSHSQHNQSNGSATSMTMMMEYDEAATACSSQNVQHHQTTSPQSEYKRKHGLAVTPNKDDREFKRQKASPHVTLMGNHSVVRDLNCQYQSVSFQNLSNSDKNMQGCG